MTACRHPQKEVPPRVDGPPEAPEDLAKVANEKGIPLDLMRRALALGFPADAVKQQISLPGATAAAAEAVISEPAGIGAPRAALVMQIEAGIRADQAERFISQQERMRDPAATGQPALDLSWMRVPTEWGIRARVTKKGLTVGALNVGTYGDIPDEWPYQTEMPRGAYPIAGVPAMGYSIYEKAELWAENVADLYEEAIQRRWRPATDIPRAPPRPSHPLQQLAHGAVPGRGVRRPQRGGVPDLPPLHAGRRPPDRLRRPAPEVLPDAQAGQARGGALLPEQGGGRDGLR